MVVINGIGSSKLKFTFSIIQSITDHLLYGASVSIICRRTRIENWAKANKIISQDKHVFFVVIKI